MRRLWQALLPVGASLVAAGVSALLRRTGATPTSLGIGADESHQARRPAARGNPWRAIAVDFISDVLAETYRKLRSPVEHERKRR